MTDQRLLGAVHLPYSPFPATLPDREPATVYSWAYNNIWDPDFPGAQGGEVAFRYAVATDDEAALGRERRWRSPTRRSACS